MIPDGWKLNNLEEIGDFKNGINKSKEDFGFGVPFVNLMDVFGTSAIGKKNYALVNATKKEVQDFNLVKGDVLFIRSSVKPQGVGLTSVVIEDIENTVYSGFIIRFRPKIAIDHNFMRYCFYEEGFRLRLLSNSTISANTNINQQALNKLTLLLPPLLEQCRIAEVLGVWDESIDLLERLIGRVRSRKQGLMQQLLTGKKRFKEFEGSEWTEYSIKDLCKVGRGRVISRVEIESNLGSYPVYSSQTSNNGEMGRIATYDFDGEYVTWTTDGANAGTIFYRNGKFNCTNVCGTLQSTNKHTNMQFLAYQLSVESYKHVSYTLANPKLMNKEMGQIILRFPPLPEQEKIAAVLSAADEEISTLEKQLAAYKQQKLGLMQQLLTGKIRVG
jgi:type I restriction enzyme, S subunit